MLMSFSLFCEHAQVTSDGMIFMLNGGVTMLTAPTFPAVAAHLFLVTRLVFEPDECGHSYKMVVRMLGPKGDIATSDREIIMAVPKNKMRPSDQNTYTCLFDYSGTGFFEPGDFSFGFLIEGREIGKAIFPVFQKSSGE